MSDDTITLTQDFPSVPFNPEPPSFEEHLNPPSLRDRESPSGDVIEDSQSILPPHITKLFQDLALQTEYAPCEIMEEAQDILAGLQEGRLQYQGINQESFFVELLDTEDSSIRSFHGPHVTALIQYYGADKIFDQEAFEADGSYGGILFDALGGDEEAYGQSITNAGLSLSAEAIKTFRPDVNHSFPGVPKIQNCFSS